jgi:intein/homing endonuclease
MIIVGFQYLSNYFLGLSSEFIFENFELGLRLILLENLIKSLKLLIESGKNIRYLFMILVFEERVIKIEEFEVVEILNIKI